MTRRMMLRPRWIEPCSAQISSVRAPPQQSHPRRRHDRGAAGGQAAPRSKARPQLAAADAPAGTRDPRPAPRALRAARQRAARPSDRRAGPDRPLAEHQRPQPRRCVCPAPSGSPAGRRSETLRRSQSRPRSSPGPERDQGSRIQEILGRLGDHPDLDWLAEAPREEALEFLTDLPGVGRKTATCVLIFAFGRPEIPVDVHVHRVGAGSACSGRAPFDEAHDEMLAIIPPEDAYELHINLIRHGRAICRPTPRCGCALRRMCPYFRQSRTNMLRRQG